MSKRRVAGFSKARIELVRDPKVHLRIGRDVVRVEIAAAQSAAVDHIGAKASFLPEIG